MSRLVKVARFLRLVEERVVFDKTEPLPNDVLIVPPGSLVEGQLHTNMSVVLGGEMHGSINIKGDAKLLVLEGAKIRGGLVSADLVEMNGVAIDVGIDADRMVLSQTGRVEGNSQVRYGKLTKHEDAPIDGRLQKRKSARDGFTHQIRSVPDVLFDN